MIWRSYAADATSLAVFISGFRRHACPYQQLRPSRPPQPYKVVFDLTSSDPIDQQAVLRWINEVKAVTPRTETEVVTYGHCQLEATAGRVARCPRAVRYPRYGFAPAIISHAVCLYDRFALSFRHVEDVLVQRDITVSYETIRHWSETFGLAYARRFGHRAGPVGDTWHLDERFVPIRGQRQYLWRAVDQVRLDECCAHDGEGHNGAP